MANPCNHPAGMGILFKLINYLHNCAWEDRGAVLLFTMLKHMQDEEVIQDSQQGSTKGRSCLVFLLSQTDGISGQEDNGCHLPAQLLTWSFTTSFL